MPLSEIPEEVVFKSEASMWEELNDFGADDAQKDTGLAKRNFDVRLWDVGNERIYALSISDVGPPGPLLTDPEKPWLVKRITFVNKSDGRTVTRAYMGLRFPQFMPGYGVLLLGPLVGRGQVAL